MSTERLPLDQIRVRYVGAPRVTHECDCDAPNIQLGAGSYPFRDIPMQRCTNCGTCYILPEYSADKNTAKFSFKEAAYLVQKPAYEAMCKFIDKILVGDGYDDLNDWDGGAIQELAVACGYLKETDITEFPCGEVCPCESYFDPEDAQEHICYRVTDAFRVVQAGAKEST